MKAYSLQYGEPICSHASLLCVKGGAEERGGGIVKSDRPQKTIPQSASLTAPFTQGSLGLWDADVFALPFGLYKNHRVSRVAEGLAAARSRSRSDTTQWCHSFRSRRFATSTPTRLWVNIACAPPRSLHKFHRLALSFRHGFAAPPSSRRKAFGERTAGYEVRNLLQPVGVDILGDPWRMKAYSGQYGNSTCSHQSKPRPRGMPPRWHKRKKDEAKASSFSCSSGRGELTLWLPYRHADNGSKRQRSWEYRQQLPLPYGYWASKFCSSYDESGKLPVRKQHLFRRYCTLP